MLGAINACIAIACLDSVDVMRQISLRLADELVAAIDRERGNTPRERWIRWRLEEATGGPGEGVTDGSVFDEVTAGPGLPADGVDTIAWLRQRGL